MTHVCCFLPLYRDLPSDFVPLLSERVALCRCVCSTLHCACQDNKLYTCRQLSTLPVCFTDVFIAVCVWYPLIIRLSKKSPNVQYNTMQYNCINPFGNYSIMVFLCFRNPPKSYMDYRDI